MKRLSAALHSHSHSTSHQQHLHDHSDPHYANHVHHHPDKQMPLQHSARPAPSVTGEAERDSPEGSLRAGTSSEAASLDGNEGARPGKSSSGSSGSALSSVLGFGSRSSTLNSADREATVQRLREHPLPTDPVEFVAQAMMYVWCIARRGSKAAAREPEFDDICEIVVPRYYSRDFRHNANGDWDDLATWLGRVRQNRERAKSIRMRLTRSEREHHQPHKATLQKVSVFLQIENIIETLRDPDEEVRMPMFVIADIEDGKIVADHVVYDMSPFKHKPQLECCIM